MLLFGNMCLGLSHKMAIKHCAVLAIWVLSFVSITQSAVVRSRNATRSRDCYSLPSDPEWPSTSEWAQLNKAVNGRLIAGRPVAEVCRGSGSKSKACVKLQETWIFVDPQ